MSSSNGMDEAFVARRGWLLSLLGILGLKGQSLGPRSLNPQPDKPGVYYITGFFHRKDFNDCTVPPIITRGKSREDALLRCCQDGGLTVWTEEEWLDFRTRLGKDFDKGCKQAR